MASALAHDDPKGYGDRLSTTPEATAGAIATGTQIIYEAGAFHENDDSATRVRARDVDPSRMAPHSLRTLCESYETQNPKALIGGAKVPPHRIVPVRLVATAIRRSGFESSARQRPARELADAATDLVKRGVAPQIDDAAVWTALQWRQRDVAQESLRLEIARRVVIRRMNDVAGENAAGGARIGDFRRWADDWHHPARLARARTITGVCEEGRFEDPAVTRAGAKLPSGTWRIGDTKTLHKVAEEEGHCIGNYSDDLRCGTLHAIMIEGAGETPRALLTVYESIDHDSEDGTVVKYTVKEIASARNRAARPAQKALCEDMVDAWNRTVKAHAAAGTPLIVGKANMSARLEHAQRTISLERCERYWTEVLGECVPEWLRDLAPERGGVAAMLANGSPVWSRLYTIGKAMVQQDLTSIVGLRATTEEYLASTREGHRQSA